MFLSFCLFQNCGHHYCTECHAVLLKKDDKPNCIQCQEEEETIVSNYIQCLRIIPILHTQYCFSGIYINLFQTKCRQVSLLCVFSYTLNQMVKLTYNLFVSFFLYVSVYLGIESFLPKPCTDSRDRQVACSVSLPVDRLHQRVYQPPNVLPRSIHPMPTLPIIHEKL